MIATVAELRAYLDLESNRGDPLVLQGVLDSAEKFVTNYTGRTFAPDPAFDVDGNDTAPPVTKTFLLTKGQMVVRVPDLREATTVTVGGTAVTQGIGYQFDAGSEPAQSIHLFVPAGAYGGVSYIGTSPFSRTLSITGRWGFAVVPPDIKDATLAMASRRYRERNAAWADSLAMPDGSVLSYFRQLPSSIQGALDMYRSRKVALV